MMSRHSNLDSKNYYVEPHEPPYIRKYFQIKYAWLCKYVTAMGMFPLIDDFMMLYVLEIDISINCPSIH